MVTHICILHRFYLFFTLLILVNLAMHLWELLSRGKELNVLIENASKEFLKVICPEDYEIWARVLIGRYQKVTAADKAVLSSKTANFSKERQKLARKLGGFIKGLLNTMDLNLNDIQLNSVYMFLFI